MILSRQLYLLTILNLFPCLLLGVKAEITACLTRDYKPVSVPITLPVQNQRELRRSQLSLIAGSCFAAGALTGVYFKKRK